MSYEGHPLQDELETFEAHRAQMLASPAAGRYVLVKGEDIDGPYGTENDAIAAGYRRFGNVPFLVRKVMPYDVAVYLPVPVVSGAAEMEKRKSNAVGFAYGHILHEGNAEDNNAPASPERVREILDDLWDTAVEAATRGADYWTDMPDRGDRRLGGAVVRLARLRHSPAKPCRRAVVLVSVPGVGDLDGRSFGHDYASPASPASPPSLRVIARTSRSTSSSVMIVFPVR